MLSPFQKKKLRIKTPRWNKPSFKEEKHDMVLLYERQTGNSLRRVGGVFMGLCPFHLEDTPSFAIYEDSNSYYCYGCNAGGTSSWFKKKLEEI